MNSPTRLSLPVSLSIDEPLMRRLQQHLFPGDGDEHGAVLVAGIAETPRGTRLLARDLFPARDGVDYVPGQHGYRALTPRFVAEKSGFCGEEKLCYLAVHCHGGSDSVGFSEDDLASHRRGYPALLEITEGGPVGALVFAANAMAGVIWTPNGQMPLSHATIIGPHIRKLYPEPPARPPHADPVYDRHTRLFGDVGQAILAGLKVGIIGLGGGGSLMNEWLARLGVGHIVGIDFDRVDLTNLPRIVGATRSDAWAGLAGHRNPRLQALAKRLARHKVHVARRVAKQANPHIRYDAVVGDVLDEPTARRLADVDFLVLASDTIQSRLVFNVLVQQYLIPGVQIGAKVSANKGTGTIGDIFAATRLVLPYPGGGCLECHGLIPPSRLQEEALSARERRSQRYVDDDMIAEPSVITLNALSAAQAANDLLLLFTGLYEEHVLPLHQMHFVRERQLTTVDARVEEGCLYCSNEGRSRRARGDSVRLPCRFPSQ